MFSDSIIYLRLMVRVRQMQPVRQMHRQYRERRGSLRGQGQVVKGTDLVKTQIFIFKPKINFKPDYKLKGYVVQGTNGTAGGLGLAPRVNLYREQTRLKPKYLFLMGDFEGQGYFAGQGYFEGQVYFQGQGYSEGQGYAKVHVILGLFNLRVIQFKGYLI